MSGHELRFFVGGEPVQQGSKRIGRAGGKQGGRPILIDDNDAKLRQWRGQVEWAARTWTGPAWGILAGPLEVELTFYLTRGDTVRRALPFVRPDLDKLTRAVLDALTAAHVYVDDALVVDLVARKRYATALAPAGVAIAVRPVAPALEEVAP